MSTCRDKDELEDGTGFVSSPIRVADKGTNKRENIDRSCPFAHVVGSFCIALMQHPRQKQHQIDPQSEKGKSCQPLVH